MKKCEFIRTALFVPGNQPERIDKAVHTTADVVIIDLEDAVPFALKKKTRPIIREKILQHKDRKIFVRINGLDSDYIREDLDAVVVENLSGIVIPKVESPWHIQEINQLLLKEEKKKGIRQGIISIIPLIESALAVQNVAQIVSHSTNPERLFTVAFGAGDFALDMGIEITKSGEELCYPRARIALACRAAKVDPPLDTPFMIDLKDREAFEADVKRARQYGFQGKLCIHPNQVDVCNQIFSPSKDEIEYARKVIEVFEEAEARGKAAIQFEGKFIDYPIVERCKRILMMAAMIS